MIDFKTELEKVIAGSDISYNVKGIVTAENKVYPLGTDTKVLSSIFEMIIRPAIFQVAENNNLTVWEARTQNYYPDFTLMRDVNDREKIAIDVKTTYREKDRDKVVFTLGSYTSFLRNGTKNIEFPYNHYAEHWIVGFIYKRKSPEQAPAHIYDLSEIDEIPIPFDDVDMFVAEKWKIAGDRAGSGNTTNIGSISGELRDFQNESGPFVSKEEYLEYWRNYGRTKSDRTNTFCNISEFRAWKAKQAKKTD